MKHLFFAFLILAGTSAQAIEIDILKPNFRCQSKRFVMDDSTHLTVLEDKVSGINHIELVRSWFGGLHKSTYQVAERVDANTPGLPLLFEGNNLRLAIQLIPITKGASLDAILITQSEAGSALTEELWCEELH